MSLRRVPTSRSNRPKLIITIGDPSGIGPEVTLKALASRKVKGLAAFFVVGDSSVIARAQKRTGIKLNAHLIDLRNMRRGSLVTGKSTAASGLASMQYIDAALHLLSHGVAHAMVTAPINKSSVRMAGYRDFEGHTEYLAEKSSAGDVAMMFAARSFKITLVTRHIPLKDVPRSINREKILSAIRLTHDSLRKQFGIRSPRIAVAGLNPHAGEGGIFGGEEKAVIAPAIKAAARTVRRIAGPVPPDIVFGDLLAGKYDAAIAMYHDQGLIPFKLLHFNDGVNMTIGLPFVRTSPDHGTAFDIAGKGIADPSSMIEAIILAARCSTRRS